MNHLAEARKWVEQAQAADGNQWAQYYCQTSIAHALIAICERLDAMAERQDLEAERQEFRLVSKPPRTERE